MKDIKDIDSQKNLFIDVIFNRYTTEFVEEFFHGAKPADIVKEEITAILNKHNKNRNTKEKNAFAESLMRSHAEKRQEYVDRFKNNKRADVELVDKIILAKRERFFLNSMFHVGKLSDDYAESRTKAFGNDDFYHYRHTIDGMDEIAAKAEAGAILRVWYAHNATDLCGLMALLHRLRHIECTVIELELPQNVYMINGRVKRNCREWDDLRAKDLCIPISEAKILTQKKKERLLSHWDRLVKEDSEYRIFENGEVKSTDFEYLREKAVPVYSNYKGKFSLTQLMGRLFKHEAFKDLPVITVTPQFIYRLIDVGDLEYLGRRGSIFSEDCWLSIPQSSCSRKDAYERKTTI